MPYASCLKPYHGDVLLFTLVLPTKYLAYLQKDGFSISYLRMIRMLANAGGFIRRVHYITEKDGIMLFRRPKRFCGINAKMGV
jgi:hypothetical protein